jgi:hypothetical protein
MLFLAMKFSVSLFSLFSFLLLISGLASCGKKETPVSYYVTISKKYDSLPCSADIEYRFGTHDPSDTHNEQISGSWNLSHNCNINEKVTLKATAVNNVKSILVMLEANGYTNENSCYTQTCTAYVEQNLGN